MDIELEKSEIVSWVQKLKDISLIEKIKALKKESEKSKKTGRMPGSGKYLIEYIADDFNAPLDDHFKDYMPS
jgi:hypothetical protein